MEIPNFRRPKRHDSDEHSDEVTGFAETASVLLNIKKKKVKASKKKIRQITQGMAEIAYSLGDTNDPDEYAEIMSEDILEALRHMQKK